MTASAERRRATRRPSLYQFGPSEEERRLERLRAQGGTLAEMALEAHDRAEAAVEGRQRVDLDRLAAMCGADESVAGWGAMGVPERVEVVAEAFLGLGWLRPHEHDRIIDTLDLGGADAAISDLWDGAMGAR